MKLRKRGYVGTTSPEITERETMHGALARQAAAEGFVLLKNEDHTLPLKKGSALGLYGAGAVKTVKGGTGSGDVNNRRNISIYEGLQEGGFAITAPSAAWLENYQAGYAQARNSWREEILRKTAEEFGGNFFYGYSATPFSIPAGAPIDAEAAKGDGADTAVYVLSRIAGENADRHDVPGDYYVTDGELEQMEDELRQAAYYEAKYGLVIRDIIARENFSVTRRELEEEAAAIAERQHSTIEMVYRFFGEDLAMLEKDLKRQKAEQWIFEKTM